MALSILKNILLILFLGLYTIALKPMLPGMAREIDLIIIFLVLVGVLSTFRLSLFYALAMGLLLDLFSSYFFGLNMLALVITFWILDKIFNQLFSNRSLYSIILFVVGAEYVYHLFFLTHKVINAIFIDHDFSWQIFIVYDWLGMALANSAIVVIIFLAFYYTSNRFKNLIIR